MISIARFDSCSISHTLTRLALALSCVVSMMDLDDDFELDIVEEQEFPSIPLSELRQHIDWLSQEVDYNNHIDGFTDEFNVRALILTHSLSRGRSLEIITNNTRGFRWVVAY